MLSNSPTPTNADDVTVIQADREAAASLAEWLTASQKEWEGMTVWFVGDAPRAFRDGAFDSHEFVQAFARHRIAHQSTGEVERLTRPIIGIENRTPLEVFDIMSDRILSALAIKGGGHAE